jgi:1-acyl-sn-glycerol-3-phosphate acyltransferase
MTLLRSLAFNIVLYAVTVVIIVACLPILVAGSREANLAAAKAWTRTILFLLRTIAGTSVEMRGLENVPKGGLILASKHQSMFETVALFPFVEDLTVVMKRELMLIPIFGWYTARAGMIPVDRSRGSSALRSLVERVRAALGEERRVLIFPEGTRRPPGAEPAYHSGIAHLYRALDAVVVPVALNSGLYWPRRKLLRHPGTIIVEFLPPIRPGLPARSFLETLEGAIETASDRLLVEAWKSTPRPPFPAVAARRMAELR